MSIIPIDFHIPNSDPNREHHIFPSMSDGQPCEQLKWLPAAGEHEHGRLKQSMKWLIWHGWT